MLTKAMKWSVLVVVLLAMVMSAAVTWAQDDAAPTGEAPVVVDVETLGDLVISPDTEDVPGDEEPADETTFMAWLVQTYMVALSVFALVAFGLVVLILIMLIRVVMPKLAEMYPAGAPIFEAITTTADTISDDVYEKLKAAAAATAFTWDDDLVAQFQDYLKTQPRG